MISIYEFFYFRIFTAESNWNTCIAVTMASEGNFYSFTNIKNARLAGLEIAIYGNSARIGFSKLSN